MTDEEPWASINYSFRIMGLSGEGILALSSIIGDGSLRQGSHFRDPAVSVAVFDIRPDCDYSWIEGFLKQQGIGDDKYGIFISITTSRDEDGLTVPGHVLSLCRLVGGTLDFSFCSLPDEPPTACAPAP